MPAQAGPLLDQLRREAEATIAERLGAARAEAAAIRDRATARRERRRADALAERDRALCGARDAARAAATEATLGRVLAAREEFLARVFAETERRLNGLAGAPDLPRRLAPLLAEALPFVEADGARARCAEASRPAVQAALILLDREALPVERDDAVPLGAVLAGRDDTVRVVATLAARLERLRPTLAIEAVRMVDGEGAAP